jgi:sugar transferase EpsL
VNNSLLQLRLKRWIDVVGSVGLLLLTAPLLAIAMLAVRVVMGSPVLFTQERGGRDGRIFRLVKLRTMSNAVDRDGRLLPDSERVHPLGLVLRRFSLDELPQLWNVLVGDMSLVGPRPLLARYLSRYTAHQMRRHCVSPGITGWAQVVGRNHLSWEQKFALDLWYVDHWSLGLDLSIMLKTIWEVCTAADTLRDGRLTEREFTGAGETEVHSQSGVTPSLTTRS